MFLKRDTFGYKGFDLSIVLGSAWNFKLYNGNKYFYEGMNSKSNMLKSTLNAWTPDNRNTDVPRAIYQDPNGNMKESDRFLENGDFVRLRQAQLGYTLPKSLMQKFYIEKLRFYVSGENLFTITGYDGPFPRPCRRFPYRPAPRRDSFATGLGFVRAFFRSG